MESEARIVQLEAELEYAWFHWRGLYKALGGNERADLLVDEIEMKWSNRLGSDPD